LRVGVAQRARGDRAVVVVADPLHGAAARRRRAHWMRARAFAELRAEVADRLQVEGALAGGAGFALRELRALRALRAGVGIGGVDQAVAVVVHAVADFG